MGLRDQFSASVNYCHTDPDVNFLFVFYCRIIYSFFFFFAKKDLIHLFFLNPNSPPLYILLGMLILYVPGPLYKWSALWAFQKSELRGGRQAWICEFILNMSYFEMLLQCKESLFILQYVYQMSVIGIKSVYRFGNLE